MWLKLSENSKGIFCGVLAAFSFAAYVLINRYVYTHYSVQGIDYTATFLLAGGFFALTAMTLSRIRSKANTSRKSSVWPVALNGTLAGIGIGILVYGQGYTTAINASILATSTIITTAIFSKYILKESLSRNQICWLGIMFIGLYVAIVGFNGIHLNKGDLLVICSCFLLGFTNVFSKVLMKKHDSQFIADVRLISGGVFFLFVGLILSGSDFLVTSAGYWPLLAGFFFWLAIRSFYAAIKYINPTKAIVFANTHPVVTPFVGVLLLSEPYHWSRFLGSVILIASIYYINKK